METIAIDGTKGRRIDPYALHSMYRLRHTVFRERLGWAVRSHHGLEQDEYDALEPVYLVARGRRREVVGCVRLLPTTGPYMLRDTFPQLLAGETAPANPGTWDLSRLAVTRPENRTGSRDSISHVTIDLFLALIDHGLEHGIDCYVAVISCGLERILRRIGLPMERFGDGRARWAGDTLSVAIRVSVDQAAREAIAARKQARRAA